ncbi:AAA family ATPase [Novosphingobium taihuense]|uniref:Exopolysaccharide/PEP-CTERM locus tyrosine autokinase n=1 Tax=Novosphingobium taihuense TaxID=260085 RepID=A0A7W7ET77_9SPHN|nr:AAA family ATPase [Novosphingobium taihuense]MBB4612541.1 exopolysaccharide/PEP-CTERM locus tyrosine autokinase [Novosphingobium taihuense]TWH88107.1 exopolysaccharide/PEP-CTERM locus tyrosine autokinase [Novosphingobium taihuense]
MTDQSKIPLPASGPSLIERASGAFDFRTLTRPVVPDLPPAPMPKVVAAPPAPAPAPFVAPVAMPEPEPEPEVRHFTGPRHVIDRAHLREQCLIEPESSVTGLLEEFRIVKRQLLRTAAESRGDLHGERILVASAHPGEGKTFCAVNLALSMAAEKDTEVLLVDADFAKPSVLSTLGLPGGPGLMDALADPDIAVEDCVLGTDIAGLYVLPAGNATGSDTEYLASARTEAVLERLTRHSPNRIVIFDSPPVLAASPASVLAHHVGQTVVIVRADLTGEAALRDAVSLLGACDDIKLLLNGTRFSTTGRRFGTYYGYKE